ncbi:MAG: HAD-IIB family hydrolase [Pseudomonadota bacterium]
MKRLLLCTDLDRTLLPNGSEPESPGARACFDRLARRHDVALAYVSGRSRALVEQAMAEFGLPRPQFVISDVGSTIYRVDPSAWHRWEAWDDWIAADWQGRSCGDLRRLLGALPGLHLQEEEKQNRHKLSYYADPEVDAEALLGEMRARLDAGGIKANLVWSMEMPGRRGLLDILPASAGKLQAIRFLMRRSGFGLRNTLFAGDSGNDLDVMQSEIPSVLVANADVPTSEQAQKAQNDALYVARGGYLGMNGNYSAGIIEGAAHFWPEIDNWLREPGREGKTDV